jgi:hypothetical protein
MPSPERLGVGGPQQTAAGLDLSRLGKRLQDLGAMGWHLDPMPAGGFRFTCWLAGDRPGVQKRIEATGRTQQEAAQQALELVGKDLAQHP